MRGLSISSRRFFAPIVVVCSIALTSAPSAATITAASCSQSDVQVTVNAAGPGDTVLVPAGSATWTPVMDCETVVGNVKCMLVCKKGIILKGGIGGTTAISLTGDTKGRGAIKFSPDAASLSRNDPFEFCGFTIESNNQVFGGSLCIYPFPSMAGIIDNVKIHDNIFKNASSGVIIVNGPVYGVAYANTFISCGDYMVRFMGGDDASWGRVPREYGTKTQFFFEDNVIRFEANPPHGVDAFMTGQGAPGLVMRYNTFDLANSTGGELGDIHGLQSMQSLTGDNNCPLEGHPPCDPTLRVCEQWSTIKAELYGNRWTNLPATGLYLWIIHRGSWLMMFNNTISGAAAGNTPQYGECACDTCTSKPGYPSMHVQNTYVWNNTANGIRKDMTKRWDYCASAPGSLYTITENVDYWNYNPNTLNGTDRKGINCGPDVPTCPCSPGDGYWQTSNSPCSTPPATMDDMKKFTQSGKFYKCNAQGTWELYYRPYTYPHPLRGSPANAIHPTGTRTVSRNATIQARGTTFTISLPGAASIRSPELTIFDLSGRKVFHAGLGPAIRTPDAGGGAVYECTFRPALGAGTYIAVLMGKSRTVRAELARVKFVDAR